MFEQYINGEWILVESSRDLKDGYPIRLYEAN